MPEENDNGPTENLVGRTLRNGEYTIQRVLGHGGMGKVYLATHTTLNVPLAIKQTSADRPLPESVAAELNQLLHYPSDADYRNASYKSDEHLFPSSGGQHTDRFLREALLLARSEHLAIPMLYDYFCEGGYWYLVMDYVPGPTLGAHLRKHAPLSALEALNYALQLCNVLDYLHQQQPPIIFRDLKPFNVIITPNGTLMVIDFGIARYFRSGQGNDTTDFGSPGYASPEQYLCAGQTDARSDLYSLGVILHEMLTGKRPKGVSTPLMPPSQLNSSLSAAVSGLVTLATRTDPQQRYQSAQVFYQALERVYTIEERRSYQHTTNTLSHQLSGEQIPINASVSSSANGVVGSGTGFTRPDFKYTITSAPTAIPATPTSEPQQAAIAMQPNWSAHLEQRYQLRQSIQQARKAQQDRQCLEQQLASFDESLKRRVLTPRVPLSSGWQVSQRPRRMKITRQKIPCALQASFLFVLIVFLAMAGLLIYVRSINNSTTLPNEQAKSPSPTITPYLGSWQALPSLPVPQADNAATYALVQGHAYMYMSGGYRSQHHTAEYDRGLYRYDIAAKRWERVDVPHFPGMVNNAAASDNQGHIFFTSGYSTDTYTVSSVLYQYDPLQRTLTKITPPAGITIGFGNSMFADEQGHLYITQGFMKGGQPTAKAGNGWYRYDIATKQWHQLAPLPTGLGYTILTTDNTGAMLLFGGANDAGQHQRVNQIYRYDIANGSWAQMTATTPTPLSGASSCILETGKMVVVGGRANDASSSQGQSWLVDLYTLHWQPLAPPPFGSATLGNAMCDGNGHALVERGADSTARPTQDFWELTPEKAK
jgi:serine/threonine protein kinase